MLKQTIIFCYLKSNQKCFIFSKIELTNMIYDKKKKNWNIFWQVWKILAVQENFQKVKSQTQKR
jgi:hypothetical protein